MKNENRKWTDRIDKFIYVLILLSTLAIILESDQELSKTYHRLFQNFEVISVAIFSLEYIYRTVLNFRRNKNLKYNYSFYGLIDLIAVLPFFLPLAFAFDSRALRILRLIRALRVLKVSQHSKAVKHLLQVFKQIKGELTLTFFLSLILIVFSGIVVYYAENPSQPDVFNNIGNSIWWALATLTTVGYGDIYPITVLGKLIASFVAIVGIGLIAIPTGLISATYVDILKKEK
ncbi:ion transporter [Schleiferiaceae bacterium]|jgi:voltage-gated potassium channel|nr:ion transporter [Schleiferiaceae bacterium]